MPACRVDSSHIRLSYKIVEKYKFDLYIRCWVPKCITVPNFMKISQKIAEIWRRLTITV